MPAPAQRSTPPSNGVRWFFPASALGRKGIHELADALRETGGELLVLGRAREGGVEPLADIPYRPATPWELTSCAALVLPAWIEHEPRLALRALAMGIPVIASRACGLPAHPMLTKIAPGDVASLKTVMMECVSSIRFLETMPGSGMSGAKSALQADRTQPSSASLKLPP